MQSGSILLSSCELFTSAELSKRTKDVFKNSGCNHDLLSSIDFNECIQKINHSVIFTESDNYYIKTVLQNMTYPATILNPLFQLVLDGVEFKESVKAAISNRKFKNLNILSGFTSEEMSYFLEPILSVIFPKKEEVPFVNKELTKDILIKFLPFFPRYPEKLNSNFIDEIINEYIKYSTPANYFKTLVQILSEELFVSPTIHLAEIYSEKNQAFVYSFENFNPNNKLPKYYGVVHADEIPFLFGSFLKYDIYSLEDRRFSKQVINYWKNFVTFGNPNGNVTDHLNNNTYWKAFKLHNAQNHIILNGSLTKINSQLTYLGNKRPLDFWKPYENSCNSIYNNNSNIFFLIFMIFYILSLVL